MATHARAKTPPETHKKRGPKTPKGLANIARNLGEHKGKAHPRSGPNKATKAQIEAARITGIMPLDALLHLMRDLVVEYQQIMALKPKPPGSRSALSGERYDKWVMRYKDWRELLEPLEHRLSVVASRAAPYLHARLSAHKISGELSLAEFDPKRLTDEQLYSLMGRIRGLITSERQRAIGGHGDAPLGARAGGGAPEDADQESVRAIPG